MHLREEKRLGQRRLVFPVEEVGEGIEWDGCRVLMDGKPRQAAYDPDRRWAETWLEKGLRGKHPVEVVCVDGAGNTSPPFRATVSLFVPEPAVTTFRPARSETRAMSRLAR